jgi:hypothetical protein
MTRTRTTLLAMLAVAALLAAACGGGDSESSTGDSPATTSGGSSGAETPDIAVGGGFDGSLEDCTQLASAVTAVVALPMMGMLGEDAITDVEESLSGIDARIPSELEDEFGTLESAYAEYAAALDGATIADIASDPTVGEKFEQAAAAFDNPEVEAALDTIGTFLEDNCSEFGITDIAP